MRDHLKATELANEPQKLLRFTATLWIKAARLLNFRRFLAHFFGALIFPVLFMHWAFNEQVEDLDLFKVVIVADELDPADN